LESTSSSSFTRRMARSVWQALNFKNTRVSKRLRHFGQSSQSDDEERHEKSPSLGPNSVTVLSNLFNWCFLSCSESPRKVECCHLTFWVLWIWLFAIVIN
jgi:hypothetical protein